MNDAVTLPAQAITPEMLNKVVIGGDLSGLTAEQKSQYYFAVCRSLGLNPLTKPFLYLRLNGKEILYATRDCADQLRKLHDISIHIANREHLSDLYVVTARARDRHGREDESTGAVSVGEMRGDALANALMKAETKAKRRVTLSIAGLGFLDETELETIPQSAMDRPDLPEATPALSADEINRLTTLATSLGIDTATFGLHMRRLMDLPEDARITKKLLRECLTRPQYDAALHEYQARLAAEIEQDVPLGEGIDEDVSDSDSSPQDARSSQGEMHADVQTSEVVTTGSPEALATADMVHRVAVMADEFGLGSEWGQMIRRYPDGITPARLAEIEARLKARAQGKEQA